MYQRRVLTLLLDIRSEVRRLAQGTPGTASAPSARLDTINNMEEFDRQEQRLTDPEAFNALVKSIILDYKNTTLHILKLSFRENFNMDFSLCPGSATVPDWGEGHQGLCPQSHGQVCFSTKFEYI